MGYSVKILIVEDEIIIADYLFNILEKEGYCNVKMAHKKNTAIETIENFHPEIVLLDINLNGINSGIEIANTFLKNAKVIFLTGQYDESLMSQALETNPESYLTKPIKKEDLIAAVKLVSIKNQSKIVTIKDRYDSININRDDILFVKSDNNYIDIQTVYRKYTIRQSLEKFTEMFLTSDFIRVHRSYVVNKTKIQKKTTSSIFVENIEIPYSKKYNLEF
jgi:DNA-binding LytR/AlgR family response regulator